MHLVQKQAVAVKRVEMVLEKEPAQIQLLVLTSIQAPNQACLPSMLNLMAIFARLK